MEQQAARKELILQPRQTMFVSPLAQTMGLVCQPRQPLLAQLRGRGPAEARRRIGLIFSCSTEQHIGRASAAFSPLERRCGTMMSLHGAAAASRIGREVQRRLTHVDTSHHLMAIGDPDGISRAAPAMRGSLSLAAAATNAPSETLRLTPRRNGFVIPHAECWV